MNIQSGQAFFVKTDSTGPASITITESMKSSTSNYVFRPASAVADQSITATMSLLNSDNTTSLTDAGWRYSTIITVPA
ncbi:MAG: hypothetical protein WDM71_05925 [Ferruginibacter sp.]